MLARGGFLDGVDRFDPQFSPSRRAKPSASIRSSACSCSGGVRIARTRGYRAAEPFGIGSRRIRRHPRWTTAGSDEERGPIKSIRIARNRQCDERRGGRIAYVRLQGPAPAQRPLLVSSLVAVHMACQSLRNRECPSLAAGVNVILVPEITITFSRAVMARRPLQDVRRRRRRPSAAKAAASSLKRWRMRCDRRSGARGDSRIGRQPGRPQHQLHGAERDGAAQLIRTAVARSGIKPSRSRLCRSGTGTSLGDPIEMRALAQARRRARDGSASARRISQDQRRPPQAAAGLRADQSHPGARHERFRRICISTPQIIALGRAAGSRDGGKRPGVETAGATRGCQLVRVQRDQHVVVEEAPALAATGGTESIGAARPGDFSRDRERCPSSSPPTRVSCQAGIVR